MGEHLKPIIVEFVGLPGAGKTTVFNSVVSHLRDQNISVVLRSEILEQWRSQSHFKRLLQLFSNDLNQWNILLNSLNLALQVKPINSASFSKASKIFTNLKRLDSVSSNSLILMDQGLLQEIWSVGITGTTPAIAPLQSSLAPIFQQRAIAIVHFKIEIETAIARVQARSTQGSRFDQMSIESSREMLLKYSPYLDQIVSCAEEFGSPILEIDSLRSIEEKAEKIAHWIASDLLPSP